MTVSKLWPARTARKRVACFLAAASLVMLNVGPAIQAATIAGWDTNALSGYGPSPFGATTVAPNVTVGGLTRGGGVGTGGTAAARAWGGNDWTSASSAAAIAAGDFATFSVQVDSGNTLSLTSFDPFQYRRSGTGPTSGLLQYSLGGSFFDVAPLDYSSTSSSGASHAAIDLTGIAALQNVASSTTVTFRIANFGATGTAGTWYLFDVGADAGVNDFVLNGTVNALVSGNNSIITAPANANFGRVMAGQTPSLGVNLNKTGSDATTYTATPSNNGLVATADGAIAGGAAVEAVSLQLQNNANGSASTGLKSYNLTVDNTAADSAAAGQGSADPNDVVAVGATVVGNRAISAAAVNFGSVIVGASTGAQVSALTTVGDDNNNTRVTVNGTSATDGEVTVAAGASQLFDAAADTVGRSVSGSFATAGAKSGSIALSVTGEGLMGEAVGGVAVDYTAAAFDASSAAFGSNDGTTVSIDFGDLLQGSGVASLGETIYNVIATLGFTAELDLDTVSGSGDVGMLGTDLADGEFSSLAAGEPNAYGFLALFDTNNPLGEYSATYTIGLSDANGYTGASAAGSQTLTLNLSGAIVPEPSSALLTLISLVVGIGATRRPRRS